MFREQDMDDFKEELTRDVVEMLLNGKEPSEIRSSIFEWYPKASTEDVDEIIIRAQSAPSLREWKGGERSKHFDTIMKNALVDLEYDDGILDFWTEGSKTLVVQIGSMRSGDVYKEKIAAALRTSGYSIESFDEYDGTLTFKLTRQVRERGPKARIVRDDDRRVNVYDTIEDLCHVTNHLTYLSAAKAASELHHVTVDYAMQVAKDVADDFMDNEAWRTQYNKFKRQVS
jgi:hypothetical protein